MRKATHLALTLALAVGAWWSSSSATNKLPSAKIRPSISSRSSPTIEVFEKIKPVGAGA